LSVTDLACFAAPFLYFTFSSHLHRLKLVTSTFHFRSHPPTPRTLWYKAQIASSSIFLSHSSTHTHKKIYLKN
jgi:hypothetical protein